MELFTVTREFLEEHRSERGGWTSAQLRAIGIPWPPPESWQRTAVGTQITMAQADAFIAACGVYAPKPTNPKPRQKKRRGPHQPIPCANCKKNHAKKGRDLCGACVKSPKSKAPKVTPLLKPTIEQRMKHRQQMRQREESLAMHQKERAGQLSEGQLLLASRRRAAANDSPVAMSKTIAPGYDVEPWREE